jgi:hypothetical protein
LDVWFSRLDSGRAILEDLPHVDSPEIFVGRNAALPGAQGVWQCQRFGKEKCFGGFKII